MLRTGLFLSLLCVLTLVPAARAGLYCSLEAYADLPSQWRGFLRDQRLLRRAAIAETPGAPASAARRRYQAEAARLAQCAAARSLTADEAADLGACYLRLGEIPLALAVLQAAQRRFPRHFHLAANLGTAWQLSGDQAQAVSCLEQAVKLAPLADRKNEELHLCLVRRRLQGTDRDGLDDLFGVRYDEAGDGAEPGHLSNADLRRLPADAVARLQQLALWLPADGRLLWQLGELSAVQGDLAIAATLLDLCYVEMGLRSSRLRSQRQAFRAAAEAQARSGKASAHAQHAPLLRPRSSSPLLPPPSLAAVPPILPQGINRLSWTVLSQTQVDRHYRPTFPPYLHDLAGKTVQMDGYLQPLDEEDFGFFLLVENPVGCWHCEQPPVTGIVLVQLPAGKEHHYTREAIRVTGRLHLNASDPETFLYVLRDAKVEDLE